MTKKAGKKRPAQRPKHYTIMDELMASPTEPLPAEYRRHQLTRMYDGLAAMEQAPSPTTNDWRVVSDAVNLMETLIETMQVCEDASGLLMDAITAMAMAGKRNLAGNAIRLDGAGIQAVRAILEDYAALLDVLPARTMIRCHRLTEKRLHELLDGKRKPHDVEVTLL
jgi:mRNA-degrading endonuclease YafQ of YafQ-DinJ toxin-antitoxin module